MKASKLPGVCRNGQEPSASSRGGVPDLGEEQRPYWAATSCSLAPSARPAGLPPAGRWCILAAGCSHPWRRSGCRGVHRPSLPPPGWRERAVVCSITHQVIPLCPVHPVLGPHHGADPLTVGVSHRPHSPCDAQPPPQGPQHPALGAEACGRPALHTPR